MKEIRRKLIGRYSGEIFESVSEERIQNPNGGTKMVYIVKSNRNPNVEFLLEEEFVLDFAEERDKKIRQLLDINKKPTQWSGFFISHLTLPQSQTLCNPFISEY
jgi:hypothetical protein